MLNIRFIQAENADYCENCCARTIFECAFKLILISGRLADYSYSSFTYLNLGY